MVQECRKKFLNIAMLGHKRIPSREGGVEIVVEELSTRMIQKCHHVTCYNRQGHHISGREFDNFDCLKMDEYKGVCIRSVPTIQCKGLAAAVSSFFATIKATFKHFDVIHYHAEGACVMMFLPHLFKIRTVATIHGLDWQRNKWGNIAKWYLKIGEKTAVKYANEIIVLSRNMQKYFKDTYNRDTVYIPNGVSNPKLREAIAIKDRWKIEKDSYILFLGRIVPEKGLQYLLDAFKYVKTNKKLIIAGGSSDTEEFYSEVKKLAEKDSRILFTGFIQGQILEELYSNAYIYCLPSEVEGMPISLLEAMSYGNCCVVSDIPECAEIVGKKAVLFNRGNVNDLRKVLQKLCDEPVIVQQYKNEAHEYICRKYSWEDAVERTIQLYYAITKE